ncbi:hypothetical protein HG530_005720 [Fusarium avenaceum]|nr:hypothetical protein HG530_005720 [Fusarium avenaceum]
MNKAQLVYCRSLLLCRTIKLSIDTLNLSRAELASTDTTLKEHIKLTISSALGLRKTEISPDGAKEAGSGPEEASLGTPVPSRGVQHAGGEDVGHYSDNVVCVSGQDDGLGSETGRAQLGDETVVDGADGRIVGEGVDQKKRANDPLRSHVLLAGKGDTADGQENNTHGKFLGLLLHLVGVNHHGNGLVGVEVAGAVAGGKALERDLGILEATLADEPPRGLGGKVNSDDERDGPHPLKCKGDLVSPHVIASDHGTEDTRGDELAEDPAEVDVGGQVGSEVGRADFRGVGGGEGLEDSPGNTDEDLSNEELNKRLREEDDEDEADASNESAD